MNSMSKVGGKSLVSTLSSMFPLAENEGADLLVSPGITSPGLSLETIISPSDNDWKLVGA